MSGISLTTGYQAILRTILPAWLGSYFSWLEGSKKVDECGDNGCEFGESGKSDEISSSWLEGPYTADESDEFGRNVHACSLTKLF